MAFFGCRTEDIPTDVVWLMQGTIPEFDWTKPHFEDGIPQLCAMALCGRTLAYQTLSPGTHPSLTLRNIDDQRVVGHLPMRRVDDLRLIASRSDPLLLTASPTVDRYSDVWKFQVWSVDSLQEVASGLLKFSFFCGSFIGGSRNVIFSGDEHSQVVIWDYGNSSPSSFTILEASSGLGHTHNVNDVKTSADGNTALSCSHDNTLKLWDLRTNRHIRTMKGHGLAVLCTDMDALARVAVSSDCRVGVRSWDLGSGRCLEEAKVPEGDASASYIRMHSSGKTFLRLDKAGYLTTWLTRRLKQGPLNEIDLYAGLPYVPSWRNICLSDDLATAAVCVGRVSDEDDGPNVPNEGLLRLWDTRMQV